MPRRRAFRTDLWSLWVIQEIDKGRNPTINSLMDHFGLNYNDRRHYARVMRHFTDERVFWEIVKELWESDAYTQLREDGWSDKRIFNRIIDDLKNRGVAPVWSDAKDDYKLKIFNFDSYAVFRGRSLKAASTRVEHLGKELAVMGGILPRLRGEIVRPTLPSESASALALPAKILCPYCHVAGSETAFDDENELQAHVSRIHGKRLRGFSK